jgi:hypothetical protein
MTKHQMAEMCANAELKPEKRGVKKRDDWKKANEEAKVLIGLKCRLRVKRRRILAPALPKESSTSHNVSAVSAKRLL